MVVGSCDEAMHPPPPDDESAPRPRTSPTTSREQTHAHAHALHTDGVVAVTDEREWHGRLWWRSQCSLAGRRTPNTGRAQALMVERDGRLAAPRQKPCARGARHATPPFARRAASARRSPSWYATASSATGPAALFRKMSALFFKKTRIGIFENENVERAVWGAFL